MLPNSRPAAMLYVYAFTTDEVLPFVEQCQQTADDLELRVLGVAVDTGPILPLRKRPQWARICQAAAAGEIRRIVTRWTSLVSPVEGEREREVTALACCGARIEYAAPVHPIRPAAERTVR